MRRRAVSLTKETMKQEDFERIAFWNPIEVDSAYMDTYGNWIKSPDKKAILRADTGEYISTVGRNYGIVDNRVYFEGIINALTEAEIQYIPRRVYDDGKRTTMIVKLPQFSMFINTTEEQDFELHIRNSFDTTLAADTVLGLLRLICTNGMTAFDKSFEHRMIHKGDMLDKAKQSIEMYKNFQGVWENTKKEIEVLASQQGNKQAVARYIGDGEVSLSTLFTGQRWAKKLLNKWHELNEPTNLWDLYNMNTNIISHEYGATYSSKQNKMQQLNNEVRKWSTFFEVKPAPMTVDLAPIGFKNYQMEYGRIYE